MYLTAIKLYSIIPKCKNEQIVSFVEDGAF
jgi:hypothetical protein